MPGRRAPSLSGLTGWLQSPPRSIRQYRGRVVVVWFFDRASPDCLSMVPGLRALQTAHGKDVAVIAVHAPRDTADADPHEVALTAARAGMTWPIAMDHRRTVFSRWQDGRDPIGWPSTFVIAPDGTIAACLQRSDTARIDQAVSQVLPLKG